MECDLCGTPHSLRPTSGCLLRLFLFAFSGERVIITMQAMSQVDNIALSIPNSYTLERFDPNEEVWPVTLAYSWLWDVLFLPPAGRQLLGLVLLALGGCFLAAGRPPTVRLSTLGSGRMFSCQLLGLVLLALALAL